MRVTLGMAASLRLATALALILALGSAQHVQAQPAKPDQPQAAGDAKDKDKPVCLTAEQQRELTELQLKLVELQNKQKELQEKVQAKRDDARKLEGKIANLDGAIKGTIDLSDEEKDDAGDNLPVAKANYQKKLDDLNGDINKSIEDFKSTGIQVIETKTKVETLEKAPCPKPTDTSTGPEPPKVNPPVKLTECKNSSDDKWLEEYRRLVAYYEKQNRDITAHLAHIDDVVKQINSEPSADAILKKGRLDEFSQRRADENKRFIDNAATIEKFKRLIKEILDKKPCPGTKVSTTNDGKHGKKATPKKKRVVHHHGKKPPEDALPPVSIGIGIGGGFGGGGHRDGSGHGDHVGPPRR
jgi:hypothetical protein